MIADVKDVLVSKLNTLLKEAQENDNVVELYSLLERVINLDFGSHEVDSFLEKLQNYLFEVSDLKLDAKVDIDNKYENQNLFSAVAIMLEEAINELREKVVPIKFLSNILEVYRTPAVVISSNGKIIGTNKMFLEELNYDTDSILEMNIIDVYPNNHKVINAIEFQKTIYKEKVELISSDQSHLSYTLSVYPFFPEDASRNEHTDAIAADMYIYVFSSLPNFL